jgi:hypothetical protein
MFAASRWSREMEATSRTRVVGPAVDVVVIPLSPRLSLISRLSSAERVCQVNRARDKSKNGNYGITEARFELFQPPHSSPAYPPSDVSWTCSAFGSLWSHFPLFVS